jgi:hypothetical protein
MQIRITNLCLKNGRVFETGTLTIASWEIVTVQTLQSKFKGLAVQLQGMGLHKMKQSDN